METLAYIVMGFGAILALIGIVLFAKKGAEGTNAIKMFGFEFQLSGSALVIFVIGVLTFLAPILYREKFLPPGEPGTSTNERSDSRQITEPILQIPSGDSVVSKEQAKQPVTDTPSRQSSISSLQREIRALAATQLGVTPGSIDVDSPLKGQPIQCDDLDLLEIIMTLEKRYDVAIGDKEVDLESISIDALTHIIDQKLHRR